MSSKYDNMRKERNKGVLNITSELLSLEAGEDCTKHVEYVINHGENLDKQDITKRLFISDVSHMAGQLYKGNTIWKDILVEKIPRLRREHKDSIEILEELDIMEHYYEDKLKENKIIEEYFLQLRDILIKGEE